MPETEDSGRSQIGGAKAGTKTEDDLDSRLKNLQGRLGQAETLREAKQQPPEQRATSIGLAFRLATELVAGLVVGGGIGWFLDNWLGTSPIMLLVFFVLGAVAGILNVVRTARQMQIEFASGEDERAKPPVNPADRTGK